MRDLRQRFQTGYFLLKVIAAVGIISLVAVAPGLGLILRQYGIDRKLTGRHYVPNILSRLKKKGFIVFEGEGTKRRVRITEYGRRYLVSKRAVLVARPVRRPWDGYWRIVVFDIPERVRGIRDALRRELKEVGFKKLQASTWVTPDECEEYIKLLKADRRIGKYLIYLKTKDIEYGASLKKLFQIEAH